MGLFLHITDLHLGKAPDTQDYGDYKSKIVAPAQRTTRRTLLENTLQEVGRRFEAEEDELDAVVISGDLTVRNDEEGFALLEGVLGKLGPVLPPPGRILVVPGNHDVRWRTPASKRERYELFLQHVRRAGYVTPFLDGIDMDEGGDLRGKARTPHHVYSPRGGYALFAINSSNWCGSVEPIAPLSEGTWTKLPTSVGSGATQKRIAKTLAELRLRDVSRVSDAQLRALQALIREVDGRAAAEGKRPPVRIAVLHHQLLPVSTFEEFKPFEAITNLGLVRNFLRAMGISMVLHGHKHHGFIYKDHVYSPEHGLGKAAHEVLVLAGSTVGGTDFQKASICRLLRVDATSGAEAIEVASIPAVPSGGTLDTIAPSRYSLVQPRLVDDGPHLIDADTASEAYARLREICRSGPQRNVICQVREPESAEQLPDGYPEVTEESVEDPGEWFNDIVAWWQKPDSKLGKRLGFRHGHRIYAYDDGSPVAYNQVHAAARALAKRPESSRGVIVLIDPRTDKAGREEQKFPSFCIAHLVLRERSEGKTLDCTGYFRKQEVAYWWPVNLGELRHVQAQAIRDMTDVPRLKAGTLTTIAATAHIGLSKPAVAVPLVDRHYDEHPEELWEAVYSLVADDVADKRPAVERWKAYLSDLTPGEEPDRDGVPVAIEGVNYLREEAKKFASHHPASVLRALAGHLEDLLGHNREFAAELDASTDDVDRKKYACWRYEVEKVVIRIEERLDALLEEAGST
jgi:3',5'-cyclic AMP phosphodiesterase CpdA